MEQELAKKTTCFQFGKAPARARVENIRNISRRCLMTLLNPFYVAYLSTYLTCHPPSETYALRYIYMNN